MAKMPTPHSTQTRMKRTSMDGEAFYGSCSLPCTRAFVLRVSAVITFFLWIAPRTGVYSHTEFAHGIRLLRPFSDDILARFVTPRFQSGHVKTLLFCPDQILFELLEIFIAKREGWGNARAAVSN